MRKILAWPIRVHLIFILFLLVLPSAGLLAVWGVAERNKAIDEAHKECLKFVNSIAGEQRAVVSGVQQLVFALAVLPELKSRNIGATNALLAELLKKNPQYANITIADKSGLVWASSIPFAGKLSVADRKYFRDAVRTGKFSSGEYAVGRVTHKPAIHFGYPVTNPRKDLVSVIIVTIDLDYSQETFKKINFPPGSSFSLLDHKGVILHRDLKDALSDKLTGNIDLRQEIFTLMKEGPEEGTFKATGNDGNFRLFAYKKAFLPQETVPYLYVRASIPQAVATAEKTTAILRNMTLLALIMIVGVFLAFFLGKLIIVEPVRKLKQAAQQLADGSGTVKVSNVVRNGELGELAQSFDDMAESLHQREASLKESEYLYKALFDNANDGIMLMTMEGKIEKANQAFADMHGYGVEEILKINITQLDVMKENALTGRHDQLRRILAGERLCFDIEHYHKDGWVLTLSLSTNIVDIHGQKYILGFHRDITSQRFMEDHYKHLFDNMLGGFAIHEMIFDDHGNPADYRFLAVNPAFEKLTGLKSADVIGRTVLEVLPKMERSWIENYGQVVLTGEPFIFQNYSHELNRHFEVAAYRSAPGEFACIFQDITERKRHEELLTAINQHLNDIIDFLPDATFVIDIEKKVITWNRAMEEMTGVKKEEMIGRGNYAYTLPFYGVRRPQLLDLLDMDDEALAARYKSLRKAGDTLYAEAFTPALYNGKGAHVFAAASPLFDVHGKRIGAIESIRDISDRKELESKYRNIFDNAVMGISQSTPNGGYITVNSSFARMFGYDSPDDMIQSIKNIASETFVHPEQRLQYLGRLREKGFVDNYEMERLRKDGSRIWVSMTSHAVKDDQGNILYIESFAKDITGLKDLEDQLFEAQKMEAIGTLAGGIAHDFNNILGSIYGYSDMALIEEDAGQRSHHINQVLIAADRAKNLVKQILAFSRRQDQEKKPVDLRIIIKEALELIRSTIPATIQTRQNITNEASVVHADLTQIHQVIMNLCTNAVHAMGEKGGVLEVSLSQIEISNSALINLPELKPGSYANLTISDTGCGIAPDIIERIFDPFFTTKKVGEGTGLGLSVVYGIVRNHDGAIRVTSEPRQGSTFNIYLPCLKERTTEDIVQANEPAPTGHERILFVDDEKPLVDLAERMLFSCGYDVTALTSSEEAFKTFLSVPDRFDLVITDMSMPEMTGVDLVKKIHEIRPQMPVILCTGFSEYIDEARAGQLGISAFVMKPFTRKELAKTIREALESD